MQPICSLLLACTEWVLLPHGQIKTLSSDKNRAQLAAEIAQLKAENDALRKGGGGAGGSVKDAVKEFSNK